MNVVSNNLVEPEPGGHTILVVDDNPANLSVVSDYLKDFGFRILVARDGQSALEKAMYGRPDLILLDVMMPGIDGFETCHRLKANEALQDIPVIFMTALTETQDKVKGFQLGAVDYITKPLQHAEVLARVATHLRLRDLTRELQDAKETLERRVAERTAELARANEGLQVEIAERKRAEEEIRRRNRDLALLNRVIATATSTLDVTQVLQVACRELTRAFELPQAAVALLDAQGSAVNVVAECFAPGRISLLDRTIPVAGNPAIEYVLGHKTPLAVTDVQADRRMAPAQDLPARSWRERGVVSLLVLPLVARAEVIGIIELGAIERREFSEEEITLAQNVAAAAGQALETAQLHQALQQHAKRLEILHEVDRAILAAESSEAIAWAALDHLRQLVPCQRADVVLFDFEAAQGVVLATHVDGKNNVGPQAHLPLEAFGIDRELREGKTRVVEDALALANPPQMIQELLAGGLRSYINVPLVAKDQLMGSLDLAASSVTAFAPEHIEIAREVADQLAIAIRQARLYEQEQRHAAELTRALERQRELDRLKSEFVQNVSHELRTPLAIARGYAEMIDDGELGEVQPDQQEPIAAIARRLRVLSKLVEDINAVLEMETRELQREPVDLAALLHTILVNFRVAAAEHSLVLEDEIPAGLPSLSGDPVLLWRMIDNLLNNALKFTPSGGRITVRLWQEGAEVALAVADTGIGIPADQLERIFERFYQVDGSTTRRYGGTGLGLSLVQETAQAHAGRIVVESQVGRGSTFTVWLPLTAAG